VVKPSEKLADSFEALSELQGRGVVAIRSAALTRTDRERLVKNGFLLEIMKGWYIPSRPDETAGESTAWYASFWHFCSSYLYDRFGSEWSLGPEQSVMLHVGNKTVPAQLVVRSPKARNQITKLLHGTSVLEIRASLPLKTGIAEIDGLRLFSLPSALLSSSPNFYVQHPTDARSALAMIRDASEVLDLLLEGGHSTVAGRLAGAFRNIGRARIADEILNGMRAADYSVRETEPFDGQTAVTISARERSPYVNRIRLMWQAMRQPVIEIFPSAPGLPKHKNRDAYLKQVSEAYVLDAYHSLSIEGYRVTPGLINRVRSGKWNPDEEGEDRNHRDALAARGYWQAHQAVQRSVRRILQAENPGTVVDEAHSEWYRQLFAPSVVAGLLRRSDLAGYRNSPVFIRRSMHVPPGAEAVRDIMPVFFELLAEEKEASVRVVLGHFVFVYIHPYMDGNGRIGRFLMNAMLASGGYPWTVVPVTERNEYMSALENASVGQDIKPFANFLARLVEERMRGKAPSLPIR
jgi:fido (protein-threonine AMPylation protein)